MGYDRKCSHGLLGMFRRSAGREASALARGAVALVLTSIVPVAMPAQQAATAKSLVFDHVTVVDVEQGKLVPEQRVVITLNRIEAVGDARTVKMPKAARIVNAQGKYMIPGLWDMHAHVEDSVGWYARFIAHGVTGLRELGQRFEGGADSFRVWQRQVASGTRVGPRSVGPSVDVTVRTMRYTPGPPGSMFGVNIVGFGIATVADIRRVVDSVKAAGAVFLKFHPDREGIFRKPEMYFALLREARRAGLPIVGHAADGGKVSEVEMADSGMRSIEHVNEHPQCFNAIMARSTGPVEERCTAAAQAFIRNGTWLTPTLIVSWYYGVVGDQALEFVQRMRRLGVTNFLAGTDVASVLTAVRPGISVHEELRLLVRAGLTSSEALQAATVNPAKFFQAVDSLGTVTSGKVADLVLLDADPLADIRNVTNPWAVVANGRYFDRAALVAMDAPQDQTKQSQKTTDPSDFMSSRRGPP